MSLRIGIASEEKAEEFDKEEIQLVAGFELGVLCMTAGIGDIGERKYGTTITAEEARERFMVAMKVNGYNEATFAYKWLSNLDNIKRMEATDWSCNVNNESQEEFLHKMRNDALDEVLRGVDLEHISKRTGEIRWHDLEEQRGSVRNIVGTILSGDDSWYEGDHYWIVELLTDAYNMWDSDKPFYGEKYLCWDEDKSKAYLSSTPQEEE